MEDEWMAGWYRKLKLATVNFLKSYPMYLISLLSDGNKALRKTLKIKVQQLSIKA